MSALLKDAETTADSAAAKEGQSELALKTTDDVDRPMGRVSEADVKGDKKSLNRLLQRTLFLLVKGKDGRWTFPSAEVLKNENFHTVSCNQPRWYCTHH